MAATIMDKIEVAQKKPEQSMVRHMLNSDAVKQKFQDVLGERTPGFISSVISACSQNSLLAKASPDSVIASAMMAATLDLPINQNLGFAHIVPYGGTAGFQLGWRGYVQLAMRTGQYKTIHVTPLYEGEEYTVDRITGEVVVMGERTGDKEIGYLAFFELVSGFRKAIVWSKAQAEKHGKRYSKSYSNGPWSSDFSSMAQKTVLKQLLSKWGPLSIQMQRAIEADQGVIIDAGTDDGDLVVEYVDNPDREVSNESK